MTILPFKFTCSFCSKSFFSFVRLNTVVVIYIEKEGNTTTTTCDGQLSRLRCKHFFDKCIDEFALQTEEYIATIMYTQSLTKDALFEC